MFRPVQALLVFATLSVGLPAAHAQEATENYTLEKTDEGYVRMDKRTGEMSMCEINSNQMICRTSADDRKAFESEIDTLTTRIEALEKKVAVLESGGASSGLGRLPNDAEMEQSFTVMEKFFRRFLGIAKDLEREFGGNENGQTPAPDKT